MHFCREGALVGTEDGMPVGCTVGTPLGCPVGWVGWLVGRPVG